MAEEGGKAGDAAFTAGETLLLITIMQNLTSNIEASTAIPVSARNAADITQFDAEAVAQKLGYKSGGIVKTRWGQIKRKKINAGGDGGGTVAAAASPSGIKKRTTKKSAKAAAAAADAEASDEDGDEIETPVKTLAKRVRKPSAKAKAKKDESGSEGEGDGAGDGEGDGETRVKAEEADDFL